MSLLQEVDFDKLVVPLLQDIGHAVAGWLNGVPQNEMALVNRITEVLGSRRRCRAATYADSWIEIEKHLLDRRGPNNTDLYGSDLAVTVEVITPNERLAKTAFLQAKIGDHQRVKIEGQQIDDALINSFTAKRSFVFAADRERAGALRVESVAAIKSKFPANQATAQLSTEDWRPVAVWLYNWLSCWEGEPSDPMDPRSPEKFLAHISRMMDRPRVSVEDVLRELDLPGGALPRAWLHYEIHVPRRRD